MSGKEDGKPEEEKQDIRGIGKEKELVERENGRQKTSR
jgi:hypothetical protein